MRRSVVGLLLFAGVLGAKPLWSGTFGPGLVPLADHRSFVGMSRQMAGTIEAANGQDGPIPVPAAAYVYAEPGLIFQLRAAGLPSVGPVGSLQFMERQYSGPDQKVYLVIGVHAKSDPVARQQLEKAQSRLRFVGKWEWSLGPLVALDQPSTNPYKLGLEPHANGAVDLYEVPSP